MIAPLTYVVTISSDRIPEPVDLTFATTDIDIYEHIDLPFLTAKIILFDEMNFFERVDIIGGEKAAFKFLNSLELFKLAVSLGSTEGLAQHPATMTHIGIDPEERKQMNVTENLVRLSIGVEDADDIIWDLEQALDKV